MGEKPLSIDEAPATTPTMGARPPLGDDLPVGTTAGSIITTRSNIKSNAMSGSATGPAGADVTGGGGSVGGVGEPEPTRPDDPAPTDGPGALAVKEQGVKYGGDAAVGAPDEAGGGAGMAGEPIPGIDVKLGQNPGGVGNTGWTPRPEPGPGPSPDRKPVPGLDDKEEKKKA